MTDLQHYQPRDLVDASTHGRLNGVVEPVSGLPPAAQALTEWAVALRSAKQIADALAPTMFCPQAFRGKPVEAAAAILAGSEVGLSPRASLNAFDPIQGTAAPRAITLRAIVQSHGHDIWVVESTATRAIVRGKRKGSDQVHESVWTMDRARRLGLVGKDNWKKQQDAMLVARATSECCRLTAADAILGIPYSYEELEDQTGQAAVPDQPKKTAQRRTVKAKASVERPTAPEPELPEPDDEPDLPGDDARGPEEIDWDAAIAAAAGDRDALKWLYKRAAALYPDGNPELAAKLEAAGRAAAANSGTSRPEPVTEAQLTKLHTVLGELQVKPDEKHGVVGTLAGREITSTKELTKAQAHAVIEILDRCAQDPEPAKALDFALANATDGGES